MKKIILAGLTGILLVTSSAMASGPRTANGLDDVDKLAITAGAAQACGADEDKLDTYEMIASRILVNPTRSPAEETAVLKAYAQRKLRTLQEQKSAPELNCREVLSRFYKMPLFKSTVYRNGTLVLPDGTKIKPVRPIQAPTSKQPQQPVKQPKKNK